MTRANALALPALVSMLLATPCRGHAENAADLTCTLTGGESPTLSCPRLDALDASKDFTVKLAGAAAGTTLALKYAATRTGARAKQEDCPLAAAGGLYSCAKRTTPGNGITLVASQPDTAPAKLDGATRALTAKDAARSADESGSDPGAPSRLPVVSYDRDVQQKLESAVAAGDADLVRGDGYRFSYTSGGKVLVVLNSQAQPLRPIPEVIDETDEIVVAVVDAKDLMQDVTVSISGCNRPPVDARVSGGPAPEAKGAEKAPLELGTPILRYLGRCAGGDSSGPTVTVKTNAASSNAASSSVQIPVNPVYRLAVGLALGADFTRTRTFGVATLPGDTIGTVTETDDRIGLAGLLFFGWYPLGRDFRKVAPRYALQRLELFIALDPKSLDQSLIIGGAFNLVTGMDFLVGWRALNKTTELQPGAGLRPGSPFDGAASSLPTAQVWSTGGLFLGFGVTNALLAKLH